MTLEGDPLLECHRSTGSTRGADPVLVCRWRVRARPIVSRCRSQLGIDRRAIAAHTRSNSSIPSAGHIGVEE